MNRAHRLLTSLVVAAAALAASPQPRAEEVEPRATPESGFIEREGARLAYRIDRPAGPGPHPAVVVVHGAGQRQTIPALQAWADQLDSLGFVVLRYDKRGTGASSGLYRDVNPGTSVEAIPELAADAAAAMARLRAAAGVDSARVGLLGGSQAGWVIPEAANLSGAAFAVILSGPAVPVGIEIRHARRFAEGLDSTALRQDLRAFRGERGYDPRAALERMRVPALWLLGTRDERVPVPETVTILEELRARDDRPWTIRVFPGTDHQLRDRGGTRVPIWDEVGAWLLRTVAKPAASGE
jgi:dipeptidyl aminopeptidase/acylaminoacyl peptidase